MAHMVEGAALGLGNKMMRQYGNQYIAKGADSISKLLLQSPRFSQMAASNPVAFGSMASALSRRNESPPKGDLSAQNVMPDEAKKRFLDGN